ncbi:MAG: hypothetical protein R3B07_08565 [Polyangiaceae bacterium]
MFATRETAERGLKELASLIEYGASSSRQHRAEPAARAHAFLRHRGYVLTPEDVEGHWR